MLSHKQLPVLFPHGLMRLSNWPANGKNQTRLNEVQLKVTFFTDIKHFSKRSKKVSFSFISQAINYDGIWRQDKSAIRVEPNMGKIIIFIVD